MKRTETARFVPAARLRKLGPLSSRMRELAGERVELPGPGAVPDLATYDLIAVSISGGKDGQQALDLVCKVAAEAGVLDRVVALHADLGADEWPDTDVYAKAQADYFGVPLVITSRIGQVKTNSRGVLYSKGEAFGDIDDYVRRRRRAGIERAWPRSDARFCTSEYKRGPLNKVTAEILRERGASRVLSVRGMRAEESRSRSKMSAFSRDARFSSSARTMDVWLPVHHWTEREIWAGIRDSGAPYHWAYDIGMPRLSCSICFLNGFDGLVLAGHFNRGRLVEKAGLEAELDEPFKKGAPLADVLEAVDAGRWPETIRSWSG